MKMTVEQVEKIKEKAIQVTEALKTSESDRVEAERKRKALEETKEGKVATLIQGMGVCNNASTAIREIIGLLTGLEIPDFSKKTSASNENVRFQQFSVLVPTKNENGHAYSLNHPVLMMGPIYSDGDVALDVRGSSGNHLRWKESGMVTATPEQINCFFDIWKTLAECGCLDVTERMIP